MEWVFPYPDVSRLAIPPEVPVETFALPERPASQAPDEIVKNALDAPIGAVHLHELVRGTQRVLLVADDISRPTPIYAFIRPVLAELRQAGIADSQIEFLLALGSHRPMTSEEMAQKLSEDVVNRFRVSNHAWENPDCLEFLGYDDYGVPVWINKKVSQADVVIGLGAIMPIEICGFTGGGKILIPGVCGEVTNSEMHWTRIDVPGEDILGIPDNPVRRAIDSLARKAGLDFIVNVILNTHGEVIHAVAGDMAQAHRDGCEVAKQVHRIDAPREYDLVVADSFPFDIELWQANKAIGAAGEFVRQGGVVILVSPCYEGLSPIHGADIVQHGYQPIAQIKELVRSGTLTHKVVGVHMFQVSSVAREKAHLILVSSGISREIAEQVGFSWAATPQEAFTMACERLHTRRPNAAVLKGAAKMLPMRRKMPY